LDFFFFFFLYLGLERGGCTMRMCMWVVARRHVACALVTVTRATTPLEEEEEGEGGGRRRRRS
jgi:hypothetical protein